VQSAAETIPGMQQQIRQVENRINLLLGQAPDYVVRSRSLTDHAMPLEVPAGLPSDLLERRDIRAAEQDLIASDARVGVSRTAYFPQLSLSGVLGGASTQLSSLFSDENTTWTLRSQVAQPLFTGGRITSRTKLAEAAAKASANPI
jgi:multidrug efflux system outer membrane protein